MKTFSWILLVGLVAGAITAPLVEGGYLLILLQILSGCHHADIQALQHPVCF